MCTAKETIALVMFNQIRPATADPVLAAAENRLAEEA